MLVLRCKLVLTYNLRKKNINQFNDNIISSEDEAIYAQLCVIWKVNSSREFRLAASLIEYDKGRAWDRDALMQLAKLCILFSIRHSPIEETWSMHNNITLITRVNATHEGKCYKLEMTISEANKGDVQKLKHISLNR
jgi:hypothetical protein